MSEMAKYRHRLVFDKVQNKVVEVHQPEPKTFGHAKWPKVCDASAVHPSQATELREYLASAGVPTHVRDDGRPEYENASHRRRALKARHFYDRNAGYSDPAPD